MKRFVPEKASGTLPRVINEDFLWAGDCLEFVYRGQVVHGHFGVFVVRTAAGAYMVDTGHPTMWATLERQIEEYLCGDSIQFIFPTHAEVPHAGLLGRWLAKYPGSTVVGDARDYHLYFPKEAAEGRFQDLRAGDVLNLGDRQLAFLPAIWRDLPTSLWAHDTKIRVLYVADAFGFLHPHSAGQCDLMTSEQAIPSLEMAQFFNKAALFWTQYADVAASYGDIDELILQTQPQYIAPAHGALVDNVGELVDFFKDSMRT